ncbi:hypothetical protein DFJ58DRAFT_767906, partial [Suillus subalutaceus]|uniref:uncharacterized protein n=1 Tax=Suillus subalutaceus TaxID=48586 RepID=UPI001B887377
HVSQNHRRLCILAFPPPIELFKDKPGLAAELARVESHQHRPSTPGTDEGHQRIRHTNLALLQTYGPNAWRIHNYLLEATAKQAETALEELKQRHHKMLTENARTLSILQIEMANVALDAEVDRLNKKEAELASI